MEKQTASAFQVTNDALSAVSVLGEVAEQYIDRELMALNISTFDSLCQSREVGMKMVTSAFLSFEIAKPKML